LSFDVPQATLFALSGRSGSGKSTVLNLAAGFDTVDSGEIAFGGHIVSSASKALQEWLRREHIGFVFQRTHLLPELNALENITLSMHEYPSAQAAF
jgi:ABC-type lipoprotein export system ATPase subunit